MKLLRFIVVLAVLLGVVVPVLAQDEAAPMGATFPDGLTVYYPESWQFTYDDSDTPMLQSANTGMYMFLYTLADIDDLGLEPGDAAGVLEQYYMGNTQAGDAVFDAKTLTTVTVNDRDLIYFEPEFTRDDHTFSQIFGAGVLDETGRVYVFAAWPFKGAELTEQDEVFDIVSRATTGTFIYGSGFTFDYPPEWDAYIDENGYTNLYSETIAISIDYSYTPDRLTELKASADDLTPVLQDYFTAAVKDETLTFDPSQVFTFAAGDYQGFGYAYTDTYEKVSYQRVFVAIVSDDGYGNLLDIAPPGDKTELVEADLNAVEAILGSMTTLAVEEGQ